MSDKGVLSDLNSFFYLSLKANVEIKANFLSIGHIFQKSQENCFLSTITKLHNYVLFKLD